jgi:signal transduction histidine kinase
MRAHSLRTRLTVLYVGSLLACGVVLVVVALAPALTVSRTGPPGGGTVTHTNLPELLGYAAGALVVLAGLSIVFGRLLAGRALRPLRVIGASARAISASNLNHRLRLDGSYQEFSELGEALDELFGRLDAAFEAQRRFVANAAHELRTPLTAERTLLQVALADPAATTETLRATCTQLLDLGRQQEQLIEGLLTLAASENGLENWERLDLAEIARDALDARLPAAIHLDARLAPAAVHGDPRLVASLVANLVDNALRHNTADGWATIATGTDGDGRATITVSNSGPHVPPSEISRLFQPFQRLRRRTARHPDGHGLGLAIVRTIATAHGATLSARANAEGGLTVAVTFRAEDTPSARTCG